MFWSLLFISTGLKLLFMDGYFSTDFEVHRNWLAITHNLPITKWYYEKTSIWTLDYPPFFAWFEYFLSWFAKFIEPNMLVINSLNYTKGYTVIFQRCTVLVSELVLLWGLYNFSNLPQYKGNNKIKALVALTFLNPSLFIVDHIHFQYNGFMFGMLILSLVEALKKNHLLSGIIFAILLNFKHIYLYIALPYFVFLLRGYCMGLDIKESTPLNVENKTETELISHSRSFDFISFLKRLLILGGSVILIFGISFGPFIYKDYGQLEQIFSRLFPFQRGLTHAYWAPNVWAIYSCLDRILSKLLVRFNSSYAPNVFKLAKAFKGVLVGETFFTVLPQILPKHTFLLTLLVQIPSLVKLWFNPTPDQFIHSIVLCGGGAFFFGWHVHEKAIMLLLFPLTLIALNSKIHTQLFLFFNVIGCFSLFPLLYLPTENIIQAFVLVIWSFSAYALLSTTNDYNWILKKIYLGCVAIYIPITMKSLKINSILGLRIERYPYAPLIAISVYCAFGLLSAWSILYIRTLKT